MRIEIHPTQEYFVAFPEHKGKKFYFAGWNIKQIEKWMNCVIRVKIGRHYEYLDVRWFKDLKI